MNEHYWLTRISPVDTAFEYRDWVALGGLDPYRQHQLLWTFFDLPAQAPGIPAAFLFRAEQHEHLPRFYVLSREAPKDRSGKWTLESRAYRPVLELGDRLHFKLRVNPVIKQAGGVVLAADGQARTRSSGVRAGQTKHKVARHDVVMDAKRRLGWATLPPEQRPVLAQVIHEAGASWLGARAEGNGFHIDTHSLRADAHTVHRMLGSKRSGQSQASISLSTLDFEGVLEVADSERFTQSLFNGIGPAKAFGCGLLLVRRAP